MNSLAKDSSEINSISSKIIKTVEEAVATVEQTLAQSRNTKELYTRENNQIIETYENDVAELDLELEEIHSSFERNKKRGLFHVETRKQQSQKTPVNHALNFHLQKYEKDDGSIFILPSEESSLKSISTVSMKVERSRCGNDLISGETRSKTTSKKNHKMKHNTRVTMLENIDQFRKIEDELEHQLYGKEGQTITSTQKREFQDTLDKCQVRTSTCIISMINDYKPSLSSTKYEKMKYDSKFEIKKLGLNIPSIKELMKEVEKNALEFESIHRKWKQYDNKDGATPTKAIIVGREMEETKSAIEAQQLHSFDTYTEEGDKNFDAKECAEFPSSGGNRDIGEPIWEDHDETTKNSCDSMEDSINSRQDKSKESDTNNDDYEQYDDDFSSESI